MRECCLIHDSSELRELMAKNPTLPIVVLADEDSAADGYCWTYCSSVRYALGWLLDVKTPYDDADGRVFSDKDDFENAIIDAFQDDKKHDHLSDQEFFEAVQNEMKKYEDDWQRVIAIYASN